MRQVILDTETTGLDPKKGHRLTEIGCLEMVNRRLTGRSYQTYLNPEREVDPGAVAITGLTYEFLKDKPTFSKVVDPLLTFIEGAELIIHNAPFDLGFINHELSLIKHGWQSVENYTTIIDTLVLARKLHPGQKNSLDALCRRYNVDNSHREYHGALLDADILARVYLLMTAGQTSLSLESESILMDAEPIILKRSHTIRKNVLPVLKATEQECALHEARMAEINK